MWNISSASHLKRKPTHFSAPKEPYNRKNRINSSANITPENCYPQNMKRKAAKNWLLPKDLIIYSAVGIAHYILCSNMKSMQPISDTIKVWVNVFRLYGIISMSSDFHVFMTKMIWLSFNTIHSDFLCVEAFEARKFVAIETMAALILAVRAVTVHTEYRFACVLWVNVQCNLYLFDYCSHKSWSLSVCVTIIQMHGD